MNFFPDRISSQAFEPGYDPYNSNYIGRAIANPRTKPPQQVFDTWYRFCERFELIRILSLPRSYQQKVLLNSMYGKFLR